MAVSTQTEREYLLTLISRGLTVTFEEHGQDAESHAEMLLAHYDRDRICPNCGEPMIDSDLAGTIWAQ